MFRLKVDLVRAVVLVALTLASAPACKAQWRCRTTGSRCYDSRPCCSEDDECVRTNSWGPRYCVTKECYELGQACTVGADCCNEQFCASAKNSKPYTCVSCLDIAEPCIADTSCCSSRCDRDSLTCAPSCGGQQDSCAAGHDECCDGLYCLRSNGIDTCLQCGGEADSCSATSQCCSGFVCNSGTCKSECFDVNKVCTSDEQCCTEDLVCANGACQPRCSVTTEACAADAGCCEGLECNGQTCIVPDACGDVVMSQDFNHYDSDIFVDYTKAMHQADFPRSTARLAADGNTTVRPGYHGYFSSDEAPYRGAVGAGQLRTTHPQGCLGTKTCGLQFDVWLPEPLVSATFSYHFRFSEGYNWTRGGKLPGMCSHECPSGCRDVNGHFNSRNMWRTGGQLENYMYYAGALESSVCGDSWLWDTAASSEWAYVKVYMRVNDPGEANGVQRTWLNGVLVENHTGVTFRTTPGALIERFTFRNFHGGSDDTWRPPVTQWNWFDNLKVQAGQCPPSASDPAAPTKLPNPPVPPTDLAADATNALEDPNLAAEVREIDDSVAGSADSEAFDAEAAALE